MGQEFTVEDLRLLAESRGYRLVQKDNYFWLVGTRDQLPMVNEAVKSLLFTIAEARLELERLSGTTRR